MIEALLKKIDDTYTIKQTEEMVAIPSVVGEEADLAEYLRNELESLGLETELHLVEEGRPNIYGKLKGSDNGRRLHFNGHTDTVPVVEGWDTDPFKPVKRDNKLYGLGSCDMKAGIACTLAMIKAFVDSGFDFNGELSFSGVIDEESHGKGAKALLSTEYGKVDGIVLAEPYPGDESKPIPYGITGKILYDVYVNGVAAHGFRPHLGVNAVEDASRIISNLDKLQFKDHPDFGTGNYCTLKIEGGYKVYSVVIPEKTRFEVNRLLVPGETIEYAVSDMERMVSSLELKSEVEVKVKPPQYVSYDMPKDHELFSKIRPIYEKVIGKPPLFEYAYGITDANIFAGEGKIPCLHLGPARGGAHQKNEYVPLDWLPKITKMYTLLAAKFLS
jgi:acetylornithine deacetylase/succinyl-diaminopimelate desuccinylase family protein